MRTILLLVLAVFAGLAAAQDDIPDIRFSVTGFVVSGDNPLSQADTDAVLAPFTGDYAGLEGLRAATDALQSALAAHGYTFHRVVLPPQALDSGTVNLQVVTFRMGEVRVLGNTHFNDNNIRASLPPLGRMQVPNLQTLSRAITVANQHPRKAVRVNFTESEQTDALDAVIQVQDQRPWQLFAGLNNTGTEETGETRLSLGAQVANPFMRDHIVTGTYTTAPGNSDVQQYGVVYQAPIYSIASWVTGFYVHSSVDIGALEGIFDVSGAGEFFGISIQHRLMQIGGYQHSITAGVQDRLFDREASITATGNVFAANKVRTRPITLRYDGSYNWPETAVSFYFDYTANLQSGGFNRLLNYDLERVGADPGWDAIRIGGTLRRQLPAQLSGRIHIDAQFGGESLLPGERFGLGGERSVRGFAERTTSADDGILLSLELWSPPIRQVPGLQGLGFFDIGYKHLHDPLDLNANQTKNDTLASVGFGLRYNWAESLIASLDWGINVLHASGEASDEGRNKWHANIQYRF